MDNTEKTVEDVISQVTAQAQAQNQGEKKVLKSRIFNCMQYEVNPKTGISLNFSEANILSCVKHKTITRFAYIKHEDYVEYSELGFDYIYDNETNDFKRRDGK